MAGGLHSTNPVLKRVAFVDSVTSKLPSALKTKQITDNLEIQDKKMSKNKKSYVGNYSHESNLKLRNSVLLYYSNQIQRDRVEIRHEASFSFNYYVM